MGPAGCTADLSPLAPWEGRAGWLNPALASWLFSRLQAETGSVCKVHTGSEDGSKMHSNTSSNSSCRLLSARLSRVICTAPLLTGDRPRTQGQRVGALQEPRE